MFEYVKTCYNADIAVVLFENRTIWSKSLNAKWHYVVVQKNTVSWHRFGLTLISGILNSTGFIVALLRPVKLFSHILSDILNKSKIRWMCKLLRLPYTLKSMLQCTCITELENTSFDQSVSWVQLLAKCCYWCINCYLIYPIEPLIEPRNASCSLHTPKYYMYIPYVWEHLCMYALRRYLWARWIFETA